MEIAVLTMIITTNTTSRICLNGNIADKPCTLVMPPNDYVCTSDQRNSKCESFNGTYYCCSNIVQRKPTCADKSTFCKFLTGFCNSIEHQKMMESDCAATCGLCTPPPMIEPTPNVTTVSIDYSNHTMDYGRNGTTNETTFPIYEGRVTEMNESLVRNKDETIEKHSGGSVLTRGNRPRTEEVVKTNDVLYGNSIFPEVTTADPDELPVSLVKTVIRGTCFDEYMYCREFVALCTHPTFSYTMAKRCALSCDRCEDVRMEEELIVSKNCTDVFDNCDEHKNLCAAERYRYLLEEKCAKTCGYCKPACRDRHPNCRQFKRDGFCVDTMYTEEERAYLCGDSCQLCNQNSTTANAINQ